MQCEQARSSLFDYADSLLSAAHRDELNAHLDTCPACARDYEAISDLTLQADVWHEVPAPRWQRPRVGSPINMSALQQWFPSLASAAALILVLGMYLQRPEAPVAPGTASVPQIPSVAAADTSAVMPASLDTALDNNRLERQQELQALVALMRAEMDRRSEETEESLRYVIAHQIQGQREIDDLYRYIRKVSSLPAGRESAEQPTLGHSAVERGSVNRVSADKPEQMP